MWIQTELECGLVQAKRRDGSGVVIFWEIFGKWRNEPSLIPLLCCWFQNLSVVSSIKNRISSSFCAKKNSYSLAIIKYKNTTRNALL